MSENINVLVGYMLLYNITYHLLNIFKTNELEIDSVTQKIRVTASDANIFFKIWTIKISRKIEKNLKILTNIKKCSNIIILYHI